MIKALCEIFVGTTVEAVCCSAGNLVSTVPCEGFAMAQGLHLVMSGVPKDLYEAAAALQNWLTQAVALLPSIRLVMVLVAGDVENRLATLQLKLAHA